MTYMYIRFRIGLVVTFPMLAVRAEKQVDYSWYFTNRDIQHFHAGIHRIRGNCVVPPQLLPSIPAPRSQPVAQFHPPT